MPTKHKLEKPICRRDIPTKINEEQFPELFREFYKEFRDFSDRTQDDLKEIHEWQSKHDRAQTWLRKGVRSILAESWQKIVTAIVSIAGTYVLMKLFGL